MTLAELEEGSLVFVDANVFFTTSWGLRRKCTALLRRCEAGKVQGSTWALVLAEVSYRLMMIEASPVLV